jgi:hypothetical protein
MGGACSMHGEEETPVHGFERRKKSQVVWTVYNYVVIADLFRARSSVAKGR